MALIVNLSPQRHQVEALLTQIEAPIYALLLVIVGASLDLPTLWLVPAVVLFGAIRVAARWVAVPWDGDTHIGLATIAQGNVALALALSFTLIYGTSGGSGDLLTTVLLVVALTQAITPALRALALRSAPREVSL
jgi:Kef-type K+ transport system membrane component KefB